MKFVDEVTIDVASGRGGQGCVSFRREIFVPRGGPDGGDGGRGGSVIFKTSHQLHSLLDLKLKTKYRAEDGVPGKSQNRSGADGKDLVLMVPPGTIIKDMSGNIIKDLMPNEEFLFLKGGLGGKGNTFYKTSVNQAPSVAQKGLPGEAATIKLELKLLADVGIIGFPNAGKSTLISHISAAKPKVADYPFTTLVPNLGVVRFNEESNFVVADMPGLIKGASQGVGLGTRFLKHIERTRCFVHVIDASGMSGRDPLTDFRDINNELLMYDRQHKNNDDFRPLSKRRQIIALNKSDVVLEEDMIQLERKFLKYAKDVIVISAATGKNLKNLIQKMGEMVFHEQNEIHQEGTKKFQNDKKASEKSKQKQSNKARQKSEKIKRSSKTKRHSKAIVTNKKDGAKVAQKTTKAKNSKFAKNQKNSKARGSKAVKTNRRQKK